MIWLKKFHKNMEITIAVCETIANSSHECLGSYFLFQLVSR